jgi:hypothetical protein
MSNPYEVSGRVVHADHGRTKFLTVIRVAAVTGGLSIAYVEGYSLAFDQDFKVLFRILVSIFPFALSCFTFGNTLRVASLVAFSFLTYQYSQRLVIITLITHVGAERSTNLSSVVFVLYFGIFASISLFGLLSMGKAVRGHDESQKPNVPGTESAE